MVKNNMDSSHSQMVALIWNIADDVLRDVFLRGQYRDVILPMVVLRRLDALIGTNERRSRGRNNGKWN